MGFNSGFKGLISTKGIQLILHKIITLMLVVVELKEYLSYFKTFRQLNGFSIQLKAEQSKDVNLH